MNQPDRAIWTECVCSCGCRHRNYWREGWDKRCTACIAKKHEPKHDNGNGRNP